MGLVSGIAVVTDALGLPWLVEGLEVEDVYTPDEQGADTPLVEFLGVLGASLCRAVVGAAV